MEVAHKVRRMMRVKVWETVDPNDPDVGYLGEGVLLDWVPITEVYPIEEQKREFLEFLRKDTPSLFSDEAEEAETKALVDQLFERKRERTTPQIRLDSGKIVYGCEVWWKAI